MDLPLNINILFNIITSILNWFPILFDYLNSFFTAFVSIFNSLFAIIRFIFTLFVIVVYNLPLIFILIEAFIVIHAHNNSSSTIDFLRLLAHSNSILFKYLISFAFSLTDLIIKFIRTLAHVVQTIRGLLPV